MKFWHITNVRNLASIRKNGLVPSRKSGVGLCVYLNPDKKSALELIQINKRRGKKMALLEISLPNTGKLVSGLKIKKHEVVCKNLIAPQYIKRVK